MPYVAVFLTFLMWIVAALGVGSLVAKLLGLYQGGPSGCENACVGLPFVGILGIAALSATAVLVNFLLPLDWKCSVACIGIGTFLFSRNYRVIFHGVRADQTLMLGILLATFSLLPFTPLLDYDTGTYHLQVVKWCNAQAQPLGLVNLYPRFGFPSSWFPFASLTELVALNAHGPYFVSNVLVMFFFGAAVFRASEECLQGKLSLSNLFLASTAIPLIFQTRFSANSPSPDIPAMLMAFSAVYLVISGFEKEAGRFSDLAVATILAAFGLSLKLSAAPLFPVVVCILILACFKSANRRSGQSCACDLRRSKRIIAGMVVLIVFILAPWFARNFASAGCLAYPVTTSCFTKAKWAVARPDVASMTDHIRAWSRNPGPHPGDVLEHWRWLGPWLHKYKEHAIVYGLLVAAGSLFIIVGAARGRLDCMVEPAFLISILVASVCVLSWFLMAPHPRYGHGFLFSFALLMFVQGARSVGVAGLLPNVGAKLGQTAGAVIVGLSCVALILYFGLKSGFIVKNMADWGRLPEVVLREKTTDQGYRIFVPEHGNQCWDSPIPCTPDFSSKLNIKRSENGNYRMFWFPKE